MGLKRRDGWRRGLLALVYGKTEDGEWKMERFLAGAKSCLNSSLSTLVSLGWIMDVKYK